MAKKGILFLLIIGLFVFVGCEETPPNTTLEWTTVATEWTTDDDWQLSYVSQGEGDHIDLAWNETIGDTTTEKRCYFFEENYAIANNVLTGQYTEEGDETLYDIVITFNYNASTDQVTFSCVGEGILDEKSFTFYPRAE